SRLDGLALGHVLTGHRCILHDRELHRTIYSPLRGFVEQHPPGTDIGDYVRFILVLAAENNDQTFATVESLTDTYWESTSRGAPTPARALHLLGQMTNRVKTGLTRSRPRE
ncbi:hypothetical protein, partial [Streptomyces hydrogenans]|uniref:hypothetical protein n=1 Tax=Streptomyces hydrogenans TaxID=1873719 RepID=UPI00381D9C00